MRVVGGDRVQGLKGVLGRGVFIEGGVRGYVVPGVIFVDVVGGGEVAGAEFEGGGKFVVCEGVVRAVGWYIWFRFVIRFWGFLMRFWCRKGEGGDVWSIMRT